MVRRESRRGTRQPGGWACRQGRPGRQVWLEQGCNSPQRQSAETVPPPSTGVMVMSTDPGVPAACQWVACTVTTCPVTSRTAPIPSCRDAASLRGRWRPGPAQGPARLLSSAPCLLIQDVVSSTPPLLERPLHNWTPRPSGSLTLPVGPELRARVSAPGPSRSRGCSLRGLLTPDPAQPSFQLRGSDAPSGGRRHQAGS